MKPTLNELNGLIWAMIVLTSIVFLSRAVIRFRRPNQTGVAADYILLLAYLFFMACSILYLATIKPIYRWQSATAKEIDMYPEYLADLVTMRKVLLINSYTLWCTLWCVKFAFLSLYWKLVQQLPIFIKMWWGVFIFTVLAFLCNIPTHLVSCRKLDFFEPAGCQSPSDMTGQLISLYYSFSADVATDLAVMFLPLAVIRKLQVTRPKKIGIAILFSIGWVCIGIAVVRVIKLGEGQGQFIPGWLALWGTIEAAVAVMVGCGPGLYVSAKEAYKSRSGRSYAGGSGVPASSGKKWFSNGGTAKSWAKMDDGLMKGSTGEIKVQSTFEMREMNRKDSEGDAELLDQPGWPLESGSAHTQASQVSYGEAHAVDRKEWRKSPPVKKIVIGRKH
ncbi:hypothetical protein OHC33_002765 [Knufia fluminis]|uniref:Rhodopsin domain-containing protein n=1 Tax=Knufia fluminis TaxID=191047 RepID=A0AAN8EXZ1_9EURO|nr:hypothetical protein OHC33_002765 [Knufia fluminis]